MDLKDEALMKLGAADERENTLLYPHFGARQTWGESQPSRGHLVDLGEGSSL